MREDAEAWMRENAIDPDVFIGYGCELLSAAPVMLERIEWRGVWFVATGIRPGFPGVFEVIHQPSGGSCAAFPGGERGMRRAIDLMRQLPETFGEGAPWGSRSVEVLNKSGDMKVIEKIIRRARGHVWLLRWFEGTLPEQQRAEKRKRGRARR